jgi:hypothetical protein
MAARISATTSGARTSTTHHSASSGPGTSPVPIPVARRKGRSAPSSRSRRHTRSAPPTGDRLSTPHPIRVVGRSEPGGAGPGDPN